ncbi:chemotaxis protein CheA [Paraneptunicella aestuarii]|uniref:chemotaxis protein CheA n=1 Tax=Paraneptunicella aestuarii TaxID=2831148 RepID=UPI001E5FE071|nr:chemotaxis protein CheA [Paraneptunicella aestuarii]UAA38744.1 chemotaxis protein CheA [Paraneptunicella aestuarii]
MTDPLERFRAVFFEESAEAIDAIERNLLSMNESNTAIDPEMINDIFRSAHSLKGGSATFGMGSLTEFTHVMETLLDKVRSSEIHMTQELIDCLFSSLDILRNLVAHYQYQDPINEQGMLQIRNELERLLGMPKATPQSAAAHKTQDEHESADDEPHTDWQINFIPHPEILSTGNDPLRYLEELAELGKLKTKCDVSKVPNLRELDPTQTYIQWQILLSPTEHVDRDVLDDVFLWIEDEADLTFKPIGATLEQSTANSNQQNEVREEPETPPIKTVTTAPIKAAPSEAAVPQPANDPATSSDKKRTSQSIRVDLEKIDSLINLLGELVITQSMLSIYGDSEKYPQFERLTEGLTQLERHTRDLQEGVMRIRMLPIDFCFSRFPRMVRDIAKKLNKSIAVEIIGETTEVDKTVIEELTDPLVHLVRNSVDHGIEMPEVRKAKGKPETGTVTLKAFHQVGNIIIEISDDGAGLNTNRIREKAIEKGVIAPDNQLNEQAINELIFAPGFSTAQEVTDLSGRGVGMDVVKRNIKALGGTIDVRSVPEEGTTFIIRLPLTLAILDGQLVKVSGETYIIPMLSIIESIQMKPKDINRVGNKSVSFKWRGNFIPIINLVDTFGCPRRESDKQDLVVVVESDGKQAGILVDELTNHQQVVVKSLEANYAKVSELSGATILGDGSVALIIDVGALISRVRMH